MTSDTTLVYNPLLYADFPDPSVVYVDSVFYMTSTSMHFMPGIPVLRSRDLAHWELVSYVYSTFLDNPAHRLEAGQDIYGQGSWASCLRYHNGFFYVCFNSNDAGNTFIYRTRNIEKGPWEHSVIPDGHHDPSLLFDDDGRVYLVYGNGDIHIRELNADAMSVKKNGVDQLLVSTPKVRGLNCEGSHMHKIGSHYYLMLIQWPQNGSARRVQWCYRSNTLLGEYSSKVVLDDDYGYKNNGVAQGGLIQAGSHWYAVLFQDRDALGRCPILLPVTWKDAWPQLGINGKVPGVFEVPFKESPQGRFAASDEFEYCQNSLDLVWQWNHNPDKRFWSVTERKSYLRLKNGSLSTGFLRARNTLTQRTLGPACRFFTKLDTRGMQNGDYAGIAALQSRFGFIGVSVGEDSRTLVQVQGVNDKEELNASVIMRIPVVYLKVQFDFRDGADIARFFYSYNCVEWETIGEPLYMEYRLDHFTGYRAALFSYATKQTGGYADFDFIRYCEL